MLNDLLWHPYGSECTKMCLKSKISLKLKCLRLFLWQFCHIFILERGENMDFTKMHEQNKRSILRKKELLLKKQTKLKDELELTKLELNELVAQEQAIDKKFKALSSDIEAYEEILEKIKPKKKVKKVEETVIEDSNNGN